MSSLSSLQQVERCPHIVRKCRLETDLFRAQRMRKCKLSRMKCLSADQRERLAREIDLTLRKRALPDPSSTIDRITQNRMARMRQVNADLVRSAGPEL